MFRLAHLSDIHLGPLPEVTRKELFSKRITGYVNWRRNRTKSDQPSITADLIKYLQQLKHDHTIITGDLINLGLELEIENAKIWLESLSKPENLSVILGNHDAYVRGARDKALKAWQTYVTDDKHRAIETAEDYPVLRRRGNISLINCNSARASAPFLATGYFKKDQAERLKEMLENEGKAGQCRIVSIHHVPVKNAVLRHKRLLGLSNFQSVIAEAGAELILHGHSHLATNYAIPSGNTSVPVVCVPSAYQWIGHRKPPAGLNIFEISKAMDPNNWEIKLIRHGLIKSDQTNIGNAANHFEKLSEELL